MLSMTYNSTHKTSPFLFKHNQANTTCGNVGILELNANRHYATHACIRMQLFSVYSRHCKEGAGKRLVVFGDTGLDNGHLEF